MVGWNVAVTQLVADRVLHKISDLVYYTSATLISINEMMNMMNASMTECCWFLLCVMNACLNV